MNTSNKCSACVHYDPQFIYPKGVQKPTGHGWCAAKSEYPGKKEPNQGFVNPDGCKVAEGDLAKPFIVYGDKVVIGCLDYVGK